MSIAEAIIADVLSDQDEWWDGELQTITGYYRCEYEELNLRMEQSEFVVSSVDKYMLHQAAANVLGYPGISTTAVESKLGENWRDQVEEFIAMMKGKK